MSEFTFEDLRSAASLYVSCLADRGLVARAFEQTVEGRRDFTIGAVVPESVTTDDNEANEILDGALAACKGPIWTPIELLYTSQQTSVEARSAHFAQYRSSIIECLEAAGFTVPGDATTDEIMQLVYQASDQDNVECLLDSGYFQDAAIPNEWWATPGGE